MTSPTPSPERIDGEFHYAVEQKIDRRRWFNIYRTSDDEFVEAMADWRDYTGKHVHGNHGFDNARQRVEYHDDQARHFIELGERRREGEVDEAALIGLDLLTDQEGPLQYEVEPYSGFGDPPDQPKWWHREDCYDTFTEMVFGARDHAISMLPPAASQESD